MQLYNVLYNTSQIFIEVSYRKRNLYILITLPSGMLASKTIGAIQTLQVLVITIPFNLMWLLQLKTVERSWHN